MKVELARPQAGHSPGGDVPAQVVAANGHSATFIVPAGVKLGAATVTATNPGGHTGSIGFKVCDLLMPEAWGGEWDITITYRDATTQSVVATDERTAFIRTGEAFGVAVVANRGNCTGNVSDQHLETACVVPGTSDPCTLGADVRIAADRAGETLWMRNRRSTRRPPQGLPVALASVPKSV